MRFKVFALFAVISIVLLSGYLNSNTTTLFDRSTSTYQNLDFANIYTLSCYLPKDTVSNYYKDIESYKLGYNQYGFYMANSLGRTDFFFYKLTSGKQSLEYLFGSPGDQFNNAALENWNNRQLSSKGYNQGFSTVQSTSMKQMEGVKESRVIRTTSKDQKGNQMIAESCWFDYPNSFWSVTSTWPTDYYDSWSTSDLILHYK